MHEAARTAKRERGQGINLLNSALRCCFRCSKLLHRPSRSSRAHSVRVPGQERERLRPRGKNKKSVGHGQDKLGYAPMLFGRFGKNNGEVKEIKGKVNQLRSFWDLLLEFGCARPKFLLKAYMCQFGGSGPTLPRFA